MKKKHLTYLVLGLVLLGLIAIYIYLQYQFQSVAIITATVTQDNSLDSSSIDTSTPSSIDDTSQNEEMGSPEKSQPGREIYTYRNTYKDPFADFRQTDEVAIKSDSSINNTEKDKNAETQINESIQVELDSNSEKFKSSIKLTPEMVKEQLPFQLIGIIGNEKKRLAVINLATGTKIIHQGDVIKEFKIEEIKDDKILVSFQDITIKIGIGIGSGSGTDGN